MISTDHLTSPRDQSIIDQLGVVAFGAAWPPDQLGPVQLALVLSVLSVFRRSARIGGRLVA